MNPIAAKLIGAALNGFQAKNMNPVATPSTGIAYAGIGAITAMSQNPLGTEHDMIINFVIAVVSLFFFYKKPKV